MKFPDSLQSSPVYIGANVLLCSVPHPCRGAESLDCILLNQRTPHLHLVFAYYNWTCICIDFIVVCVITSVLLLNILVSEKIYIYIINLNILCVYLFTLLEIRPYLGYWFQQNRNFFISISIIHICTASVNLCRYIYYM